MGVKGLWKVLRPSSEKVGPSSLSGKKVAIDASIWLYQISKGFRDKEGSELHAVVVRGFCTRICKLLEYRIYPIFIFEGRGTKIKKLTLATRRRRMEQSRKKADKVSMDLAVKRLRKYLMEKIHPADKKADKPIVPQKRRLSEYELPEGSVDIMQDAAVDPNFATRKEITRKVDELAADKDIVMNLDLDGDAFKCLPLQDQYDLLLDIKNKSRESHHSSKIVEVSEDPLKFSSLQVNYLLRRNELRRRLDAFNRPDIGSAGKGLTNFKYAKFAAQRDLQYVLLKEEPEDSEPKELLGREFLERSSSSDDLGSAGSGSDSGAGRGMDSGAGRGMDSGAGRGMDSGAGSGMDGGPEDLEGERLGNSDKSGDPISLGSSDFEEVG